MYRWLTGNNWGRTILAVAFLLLVILYFRNRGWSKLPSPSSEEASTATAETPSATEKRPASKAFAAETPAKEIAKETEEQTQKLVESIRKEVVKTLIEKLNGESKAQADAKAKKTNPSQPDASPKITPAEELLLAEEIAQDRIAAAKKLQKARSEYIKACRIANRTHSELYRRYAIYLKAMIERGEEAFMGQEDGGQTPAPKLTAPKAGYSVPPTKF